jgi:hypothetical protein
MLLTEDVQFRELDRRCDLALSARTARELLQVMGAYLNVNIPSLPEPLRIKFDKVIGALAYTTFMSPE